MFYLAAIVVVVVTVDAGGGAHVAVAFATGISLPQRQLRQVCAALNVPFRCFAVKLRTASASPLGSSRSVCLH